MKVGSIMWASHAPMLVRASKALDFVEMKVFPSDILNDDPSMCAEALEEIAKQEVILLYRSTDVFWEEIEARVEEIGKKVPIVCVGHDPSYWSLSTVRPEIVATCHSYVVVPSYFTRVEDYLEWYRPRKAPTVGVVFSRHYWVNDNMETEDMLIRELEAQGLNVIPAFSYATRDEELGSKGVAEVVEDYFIDDGRPRIDAMLKLQMFFMARHAGQDVSDTSVAHRGVDLLKRLDVPVFQPVSSLNRTAAEWEEDTQGLGSDISWSIAMPEFEGLIEPVLVGLAGREEDMGTTLRYRMPVEERCRKVVRRLVNWIELRNKPVAERKVAFLLNNNPCASVEASVGGGAHLDTLESVVWVMRQMREAGYDVEPPPDGKALIDTIMERKAISEFRWTTVDEIVSKGGALALVSTEEYEQWFNTLSARVRKRINGAWGEPPGQEMNGMPAAMVYDGHIVVTGVQYGNAVVCVQPKRGCAGSRCDGQVCKILHDPDVPPPHQYMATYRYLENQFGVDVVVHVGTHGNLEFLPGKGTGLSGNCYPDIAIGDMPHLYIYNADNPPEGTIAKRRSYATLVDHMQTVMVQGGLYEGLEELAQYLGEYEQASISDPARAHALEHLIREAIVKTNLDKETRLHDEMPFEEVARAAHEALSLVRNTQIQDGMHIFGELPEDDRRVDFINSILRYDAGEEASLRRVLASMMGLELADLLEDQGKMCPAYNKSHGELLEEVNARARAFIRGVLGGNGSDTEGLATEVLGSTLRYPEYASQLRSLRERVLDLDLRISQSREIDSLLHGFDGGYIPAGPSGLITRGRDDVLPTGRNFYSLDPQRVPTRAAWEIGKRLAEAVIEKHTREEGRIPENVAMYWMCNDIMWADGEGMAQIMHLIGVRPVWQPNGRMKGTEVIPLEELGRPRIDVTIRVSGITRDNFPNCIDLIDEAVQAVASLDEPDEMNFVRKHAREKLDTGGAEADSPEAWRNATLRIFASKPGTYQAGVQLAVYASAWKEEKDLSDVFIYWNGYAYGKGVFGQESYKELAESLKTVDVTYNKVVTDEYDLFGCCCYFGTHGGMTAAARTLSGGDVRTYYGDTREPEHVEVRDLADEVRRVVRTKLLNPKWIEGMKRHGYKGAGDISKRVGRVYGWEATTQEVDDWIFDNIASTFVLDEEMREFFQENNPWALEEIGRRLLEAAERGLWDADPEVLEGLKESYLSIESWLEEDMGDMKGEFQGGSVDIIDLETVADWSLKMTEIEEKLGHSH